MLGKWGGHGKMLPEQQGGNSFSEAVISHSRGVRWKDQGPSEQCRLYSGTVDVCRRNAGDDTVVQSGSAGCSGSTWERHLVQTWQEIIGLLGVWGYSEG